MKKNFLIIIIALSIGVFLYYSFVMVQTIEDVKKPENVGKTVIIKGEVTNVLKIGSLSGYTLADSSGTMRVSAEDLPHEGETSTVKGTLMKDSLFGYYIKD